MAKCNLGQVKIEQVRVSGARMALACERRPLHFAGALGFSQLTTAIEYGKMQTRFFSALGAE